MVHPWPLRDRAAHLLVVAEGTFQHALPAGIVMPRWRSSASVSVWVLPSSTLPISPITPAAYSSRSVRLAFPASTWATIPRFSIFTTRHVLWIGRNSLRAGHGRCAHFAFFSLDRRLLLPGVQQRSSAGDNRFNAQALRTDRHAHPVGVCACARVRGILKLLTTPRPEGRGFQPLQAGVPVSQPTALGRIRSV